MSPRARALRCRLFALVLASLGWLPVPSVAQEPVRAGDPAPPLALEGFAGAPQDADVSPEALRGHVVVLEFWATWCGPCVAAFPHLNELEKAFRGEKIRFLSITDEPREVVEPFLEKRPLHTWVALDTDRSVFEAYGIRSIPRTILIDANGRIAAITSPRSVTPSVLRAMLEGREPPLRTRDRVQSARSHADDDETGLPTLFEVSVRASDGMRAGLSRGKNLFKVIGQRPLLAIGATWDVPPVRILEETELPAEPIDILVSTGDRPLEEGLPLLRDALEATFRFEAVQEKRERDVWVLRSTGTPGPNLTRVEQTTGPYTSTGGGRFQAVSKAAPEIAGLFEILLQAPVIDRTGLEGEFDAMLSAQNNEEAIVEAAREQLGLALERSREPVEMLVLGPRVDPADDVR